MSAESTAEPQLCGSAVEASAFRTPPGEGNYVILQAEGKCRRWLFPSA